MEFKRPVKTVWIGYWCDQCGQGEMKHVGTMLTSSPPQYPHKCTNCGYEETFWSSYPQITYEYNETE